MKSDSTKQEKKPSGKIESISSGRWPLVCLSLCMLLSSLGISIPNVALPTFAQVFSATFQEVQWIIIAYLLAVTVTIIGVGRIGDIKGYRPVLLTGIALFTAASILCAAAPGLWMLITARALQGMGAAVLMALTVALVRDTVPKERTGSAMGLLGTMSAIGTALGPSLGGVLTAGPGWRSIFLILVPIGVLNFAIAYRYLPKSGQKKAISPYDFTGTLLLGLTLSAYALCVTNTNSALERFSMPLLLTAVIGCSLFIFAQTRTNSPLIRLSAFKNLQLSAGLVMNLLVATVMMATLIIGPFYLSRALGLNEALVGLIMSIGPIISTLSGVPAGRIVDYFGAPTMVMAGLFEMAAGSLALSQLPQIFGVSGYIAAIAILTPGYQLFQAANNTAVMMDAQADQRGVISGLLSLSRNLGLITGASAMGAVFAWASRAANITTASPEAVATGLHVTFAVAAVLMAAALAIALMSGKFRREALPEPNCVS